MTQENEMNHNVDGFEDAPNMVPGEVEAAEQLNPTENSSRPRGSKIPLLFVLAGLLFAGGWGYVNQKDFKKALGYQSQCSNTATAVATSPEGCEESCPLAAGEKLAAEGENCCEDGKKNAMIAALLKGTKKETSSEKDNTLEESPETVPSEKESKDDSASNK